MIKNKISKYLFFFIITISLASSLISCGFFKYKQEVKKLKINNVDLNKVKNGIYKGEHDLKFIKAVVKINVKDHKIVALDLLEHKNARGKKAVVIPEKVMEAQSMDIDTVTGATNSSKVILKAIENALSKGL